MGVVTFIYKKKGVKLSLCIGEQCWGRCRILLGIIPPEKKDFRKRGVWILIAIVSPKNLSFSWNRLSIVELSHGEQRGVWTTWMGLTRKVPIKWRDCTRIKTFASPFRFRFSNRIYNPNCPLMATYWPTRKDGMRRNGNKIPNISDITVLLPNILPNTSVFVVANFLGHHNW